MKKSETEKNTRQTRRRHGCVFVVQTARQIYNMSVGCAVLFSFSLVRSIGFHHAKCRTICSGLIAMDASKWENRTDGCFRRNHGIVLSWNAKVYIRFNLFSHGNRRKHERTCTNKRSCLHSLNATTNVLLMSSDTTLDIAFTPQPSKFICQQFMEIFHARRSDSAFRFFGPAWVSS